MPRRSNCDGLPTTRLLVRVLGTPSVPERPHLRGKELNLAVFLACQAGPAPRHAIQHALWNGQARKPKRLADLISDTGRSLGWLDNGAPVLPPADRTRGGLRVAEGVVTDLVLLRSIYQRAYPLPAVEAIGVLDQGFSLVVGPPFDGPGYDWAHHGGLLVAEASAVIGAAASMLVDLALEPIPFS